MAPATTQMANAPRDSARVAMKSASLQPNAAMKPATKDASEAKAQSAENGAAPASAAPTSAASAPSPSPAQSQAASNGQGQLSTSEQDFAAWSAKNPPPPPRPSQQSAAATQPPAPPGPPGSPGDKQCFKSADGSEVCINKTLEHDNTTDVYDQNGSCIHDFHNKYNDQTTGTLAANITGTNVTQAMQHGPPQAGNTVIQGNYYDQDSGYRDTHTEAGNATSAPEYEDHKVDGNRDGKDWEAHSSLPDGTLWNQELHTTNEDKALTDIKNKNGMTDIFHEGQQKADNLQHFHEHHGQAPPGKGDSSVTMHTNTDAHQHSEEHNGGGMHTMHEETSSSGSFNLKLKGDNAWQDKQTTGTNLPKGFTDLKGPDSSGLGLFGRSVEALKTPTQVSHTMSWPSTSSPTGIEMQTVMHQIARGGGHGDSQLISVHTDPVTGAVTEFYGPGNSEENHGPLVAICWVFAAIVLIVAATLLCVKVHRRRKAMKQQQAVELEEVARQRVVALTKDAEEV
nr:hypothetical protein B0A51_08487 [Rachicladosporium sp. CCFEE 5018]OQO28385.1 hypothetical protein B0A51_04878 [Rachicladosporium sp. CCFEE 5018]OQO28570.1 hypothetical protein B0A51_05617 [Rachicladosporium sp. CCFEE 5018]